MEHGQAANHVDCICGWKATGPATIEVHLIQMRRPTTKVVVLDRHGTVVKMNDLNQTLCVFTLSKLYLAMRVVDSLNLRPDARGPYVIETREN